MKESSDFLKRLDALFQQYEQEVTDKRESGILADNTAKTYLLHSENFVKWCRDEFVPGGSKLKLPLK